MCIWVHIQLLKASFVTTICDSENQPFQKIILEGKTFYQSPLLDPIEVRVLYSGYDFYKLKYKRVANFCEYGMWNM